MFNRKVEEDQFYQRRGHPDVSFRKDSRVFSDKEELQFSHLSSKKQKNSSQSNFSRDLNSQASDSFIFLRQGNSSHEMLGQNYKISKHNQEGEFRNIMKSGFGLNELGSGKYSQSILNKLDGNSFANGSNASNNQLSDMLLAGGTHHSLLRKKEEGLTKDRSKPKSTREGISLKTKKNNRTSIFQNQLLDNTLFINKNTSDLKRHIDFVNSANDELLSNPGLVVRKTEITRMVSMLGDQLVSQSKIKDSADKQSYNNYSLSIQKKIRQQNETPDWVKRNDGKEDLLKLPIKSFGRIWSGIDSMKQEYEEKPLENCYQDSLFNLDKKTKPFDEFKLRMENKNNFHQILMDSGASLGSETFQKSRKVNQSQVDLINGGSKLVYHQKSRPSSSQLMDEETKLVSLNKRNNPSISRIPLISDSKSHNQFSKRNRVGLFNQIRHISETEEENVTSRNSRPRRLSREESVYISELNDAVRNDKLMLGLLMNQKNSKQINSNVINTNIPTINNHLESISPCNQISSSKETEFINYLNNIQNYFIEPISKSIFLKIGSHANSSQEAFSEDLDKGDPSNLVPLSNFMKTEDKIQKSSCQQSNKGSSLSLLNKSIVYVNRFKRFLNIN